MVSMKDVAKECGVSQATVSYAYNGSPKISKEMREQIFSVAEKIGYFGPDIRAKSLKSGKVGAIGLMVMDQLSYACTDPWVISLLQGISSIDELADVALTLIPINNSRFKNGAGSEKYSLATRGLVDGLIISTLPDNHPVIQTLLKQNTPFVIIDAPYLENTNFIGIDDKSAANEQMKHILDLGHSKIAVIIERLIPDGYMGWVNEQRFKDSSERISRERLKGYIEAAIEKGISWNDLYIYEAGGFSFEHGCNAARKILEDKAVTAIVASSDVMALASLSISNELSLKTPEDISIIGFDDIPESESRGLTTIHQPLKEKGACAARILLDYTEQNKDMLSNFQKVIFPTKLIIRKSTARVRAK